MPNGSELPRRDRSEVRRDRIAAIAMVVGAVIGIMALVDAPPLFDDVSDEERAAEAVERFFDAYGDRDFATVCDLFNAEVRDAIELTGATETEKGRPRGCAEILEARFGAASGEDRELTIQIESVRVSGPRAVAEVLARTPESPGVRPLTVELQRAGDGWLIASRVITE
jgi:predicted lipid-binding transport protein (Tim44 family)